MYSKEGFYSQKGGGARKLLTRKERIVSGKVTLPWGKVEIISGKLIQLTLCVCVLGCIGGGVDGEDYRNRLPQGYLPENSRLTKFIFLENFETAMRSGIKSSFSVGFGTSDSILGLWFSL